jgi:hypothetical protein
LKEIAAAASFDVCLPAAVGSPSKRMRAGAPRDCCNVLRPSSLSAPITGQHALCIEGAKTPATSSTTATRARYCRPLADEPNQTGVDPLQTVESRLKSPRSGHSVFRGMLGIARRWPMGSPKRSNTARLSNGAATFTRIRNSFTTFTGRPRSSQRNSRSSGATRSQPGSAGPASLALFVDKGGEAARSLAYGRTWTPCRWKN